jgi:Cd2+/Zn2+-exporting ATPase
MQQGLEQLPYFLAHGRRTRRTINVNLALAISFGFAMMLLAGVGILNPVLGAVAHNVGSIAVILNSTRLIMFKGGSEK